MMDGVNLVIKDRVFRVDFSEAIVKRAELLRDDVDVIVEPGAILATMVLKTGDITLEFIVSTVDVVAGECLPQSDEHLH